MGLWKLYWRSLWAYRGAKSVQAEWKAAGRRQAGGDAVRRSGEIETIAAKAVTKAKAQAPLWVLIIFGIVLVWLLGKFAAFIVQ